MIKYIFAFFVIVHAMIHFMGFAKAFRYGEIRQITEPISKVTGWFWLLAVLLFVLAISLYLLKNENWWILAIMAVICSQTVIILSWKDAKYGTIANVIILIAAITGWGFQRFENKFRQDVITNIQRTNTLQTGLLTQADLQNLPLPVQRYLNYTGVIGKPKVKNMRIVFEGEMREKGKDWFPFTSIQYNFFDEPARLFFMKAKMFGTTLPGYHRYLDAKAMMDIRLAGLFSVVYKDGVVMDKAETVTLFNDMCLLAPATLIDPKIQWKAVDDSTSKATFTNQGITISALLHINKEGHLTNFTSDDRSDVTDMKSIPYSTPVHEYRYYKGSNSFSSGDAVWIHPDGPFVYGKFRMKEIEYNVQAFQDKN